VHDLPRVVVAVFKKLVIDPLFILARHAEADGGPDIVHDRRDVGADAGRIGVGEDGLVAAPDVVTGTRRADQRFVSDDAADGDTVTFMMVGHHGGLLVEPVGIEPTRS
jgi:hypothetical protein